MRFISDSLQCVINSYMINSYMINSYILLTKQCNLYFTVVRRQRLIDLLRLKGLKMKEMTGQTIDQKISTKAGHVYFQNKRTIDKSVCYRSISRGRRKSLITLDWIKLISLLMQFQIDVKYSKRLDLDRNIPNI